VFLAPFIVLAPVNGAISNGLPKRWVLAGASVVSLIALISGSLGMGHPLVWLALVAASTAVYSPTRYAMLPAASHDTHWPLGRINSWIEMGGATGILLGVMAGDVEHTRAIIIAATALALVAAVPVTFPSDVQRPEPPLRSIVDFFADAGRILRRAPARLALLILAGFQGVLIAGSGLLITEAFDADTGQWSEEFLKTLILIAVGSAVGALLAGWQRQLHRALAFVPIGSGGLLIAFGWASMEPSISQAMVPCFLMGLMGGLVSVPLRAYYQANVPADARGNGMAISNTFNYLSTVALAGLLVVLVRLGVLPTLAAQLRLLMGIAIVGTIVLVWLLKRPLLEQLCEIVLWPIYRVSATGPGMDEFPLQGPVLIVANHAAWFDPLWVAKVLPLRVIPMMTSVFFDVPVLHWLMVNVVWAVRVQASSFRREAPELQEAVKRLDQGECVLVFPEGMMRRRDDQLLRQFGQGVWRILRDRPQTPVIACWIEGGWGSYASYKNGPPTKNKKVDRWWPVRIGVQAPQVLDSELLEDQRATRQWLMRACLGARRFVGLDVPEDFQMESEEEEGRANDGEQGA
jgi:1-acyl-sn-glycerol-3-phosphate acyltransferase